MTKKMQFIFGNLRGPLLSVPSSPTQWCFRSLKRRPWYASFVIGLHYPRSPKPCLKYIVLWGFFFWLTHDFCVPWCGLERCRDGRDHFSTAFFVGRRLSDVSSALAATAAATWLWRIQADLKDEFYFYSFGWLSTDWCSHERCTIRVNTWSLTSKTFVQSTPDK